MGLKLSWNPFPVFQFSKIEQNEVNNSDGIDEVERVTAISDDGAAKVERVTTLSDDVTAEVEKRNFRKVET